MGDVVGGAAGAAKQLTDYTVGGTAATSPWWLEWLHTANEVAATVAAIGGVVLVLIRIRVAWREWRGGRAARCSS